MKGVRKLKKGNGPEVREIRAKAIAFYKENDGELSSAKIARKLVENFGYTYHTAMTLLCEARRAEPEYNKNTGQGLRKFLQELEEREQKAYERKKLETELNRPKFFF